MKLGILTQWTTPKLSSIPLAILRQHLEAGGSAKVLTSYPNYPHGTYPADTGGRKAAVEQDVAPMLRVPSHIAKNAGSTERIKSFLSFARSSLRHANYLEGSDVVYVYATPMTASFAALKLRLRSRIPYVLHVQDIWPESVTDSGMIKGRVVTCILNGAINALMWPLYRAAAHIIVISPSAKPLLVARGVSPSKISVIYNWHAVPEQTTGAPRSAKEITRTELSTSSRPLHLVYAGNVGHMQDLGTLVRAAALVRDELDVRISVFGSGSQESHVRKLARELAVTNIEFHGRVSRDLMAAVYSDSDFQLVLLKKSKVFEANIPSKFQAALAHGRPVITNVAGDLATLCSTEGIGITAEPESPLSLANAFRSAVALSEDDLDDMGKRARQFFRENLAPDHGVTRVLDVLSKSCINKAEGKRS